MLSAARGRRCTVRVLVCMSSRGQRGYVVRVTGVLYGTTRRSLHPVREFLFAAGFAFQLRRVAPAAATPAPSLAAFPFPAPLPRRGHRFHFTLPTPLPGARYSLRLAIPSSLCLSYHSARPELQCGYPPFTAGTCSAPAVVRDEHGWGQRRIVSKHHHPGAELAASSSVLRQTNGRLA